MASSSSSSSFTTSKNSAFSPYSQYTYKSMCIVPKEWKEYPQEALNAMMQSNFASHWSAYKKVEGAVVQIGDVAARLEYYGERFWMKRYGDLRNRPLTYLDKFDSQKK